MHGDLVADLYVLASIPDQGKTTTAILLEKKLKSDGKKVACLQINKGPSDIHRYLFENCYHYSIPLGATQGVGILEQWIPQGFDSYIFEITSPYTPLGAVYLDLFKNFNEVISYDARDHWKDYVYSYYQRLWGKVPGGIGPNQDLMELWDLIRGRPIQPVITKTPVALDGPCVDKDCHLHRDDGLFVDEIHPKMSFPKSNNRVIAVGTFPAEYLDIFPSLHWFRYNYAEFMAELIKGNHDLAVIGVCGNDNMKLKMVHQENNIVCYQPSVFLELKKSNRSRPFSGTYHELVSLIKSHPLGSPLAPDGEPYSQHNNRYWVKQTYEGVDPVWRSGNTVFCDGWVLPQYLIRDGYLEVN